jgi:hypothetical protein
MNIFDDTVVRFLILLDKHKLRYILVGGLATNYYGYSRATGDVDLWLEDTSENRAKLVKALNEFDVEGSEIFMTHPLVAGFSEILLEKGIYIDLMRDLIYFKQENFEECYSMASEFDLDGKALLKVIHINHLILEKEKSGRPKDIEDAANLKKINL